MTKTSQQDFERLISSLRDDSRVKQMKKFCQHGRTSTYDHCLKVARMSYVLSKGMKLKVSHEELLRGAMLHDYFLYDWHTYVGPLHGFHHADTALENAKRDFELTSKEENIIKSHMWPLTLRQLPKSKEAVLVCLADKICSLQETMHRPEKQSA